LRSQIDREPANAAKRQSLRVERHHQQHLEVPGNGIERNNHDSLALVLPDI
jgi:hypothetical protein